MKIWHIVEQLDCERGCWATICWLADRDAALDYLSWWRSRNPGKIARVRSVPEDLLVKLVPLEYPLSKEKK